VQSNKIPLQPQVLIELCKKWDLYFVGAITPISRKMRYILVYIDYVTKWVEDKPLLHVIYQFVVYFLFEDLFTCFSVPREFFTNQGTQFTSNLVKTITEKYKIKHLKSLYHLQVNG